MLDMEWSELALIGVVALVAIGPKELPGLMRKAGQMTRRLRRMAADFQNQMDQMAHEADLGDIRQQVQRMNPAAVVQDHLFTPVSLSAVAPLSEAAATAADADAADASATPEQAGEDSSIPAPVGLAPDPDPLLSLLTEVAPLSPNLATAARAPIPPGAQSGSAADSSSPGGTGVVR